MNVLDKQLDDEATEYAPPKLASNSFTDSKPSGFVVKGAPWSAPDTTNKEEFPSFGLPSASDATPVTEESSQGANGSAENSVWRR